MFRRINCLNARPVKLLYDQRQYYTQDKTMTRISKKAYDHKYFEENISIINNPLGRKFKVHKKITSLKCPTSNKVSSKSSEFPDIMNKYFSSIGHNLASKMPKS